MQTFLSRIPKMKGRGRGGLAGETAGTVAGHGERGRVTGRRHGEGRMTPSNQGAGPFFVTNATRGGMHSHGDG
jgi:hypothetical protein